MLEEDETQTAGRTHRDGADAHAAEQPDGKLRAGGAPIVDVGIRPRQKET
jgi:hypothetical protein